MRVLFLNYRYPIPENGGSERTIYKLTKYLSINGYKVYIGFFEGKNENLNEFEDFIDLANLNNSKSELVQFIRDNKIKILVNFYKFCPQRVIEAIKMTGCYYVASLRFAPADSRIKILNILSDSAGFSGYLWNIKRIFKFIYVPYVAYLARIKIRKNYKLAHKYVLLSDRFRQSFLTINGITNDEKIVAINNSVSFDEFCSFEQITRKKRIVLIVARMEEKTKRISMALNIWMKVKTFPISKDWTLLIVGDGRDLPRYKRYVEQSKIPDVCFEGRKIPLNYYLDASIFLMTSATEGFSNTLPEALQTGCVPIAFNSFDSLADILTHGKNGLIVQENDTDDFVRQMLFLMENTLQREAMARAAVQSSYNFSIDIIGRKWQQVFEALISASQ